MNWNIFKENWRSKRQENHVLRIGILFLVISNFMLVVFMSRQDAIVTLVPPVINETLEITKEDASINFKKSWGLFIAELIGNVSTTNADFIVKSLNPLLHTSIQSLMKQTLASQVEEIKKEGLIISFEPQQVAYEKSSQKVYITGAQIISGRNGDSVSNKRTIEVGIRIQNYKPSIFHIDAYNANPKFEKVEK